MRRLVYEDAKSEKTFVWQIRRDTAAAAAEAWVSLDNNQVFHWPLSPGLIRPSPGIPTNLDLGEVERDSVL